MIRKEDFKILSRDIEYGESSRYGFSRLISGSNIMFLETYDFKEIPLRDDDIYIMITSAWENRIDLVANEFYRDSDMWWVIASANNMVMPWILSVGTELRIPSLNSLWGYKGAMVR